MCVATATEQKEATAVLKRLGVLDYFSEVLTTTIVGANKNSPLIYEKALELLGTPKDETYVFEDAVYAIETAKRACFKVIGIEDSCSALVPIEVAKLCDHFLYANDEYDISFLD